MGQIPKNDPFENVVKLDADGFILAAEDCMTSGAESLQPETAGQRKSASLRRQRQMEQWLHLRHANILRND